MEQIKIATFGCWNRKEKEDDKIPRDYVIEKLKENQDQYNHLVILGDNYYAKKEKITVNRVKIKKINHVQEDLEYGFELVENLNIEKKYLIIGNHDIEDTLTRNCIGLQTQVDKTDKFNVMFPFGSEIFELSGGIRIKYIFIDTTVYEIKANPSCYDNVLQKNASSIVTEQNKFIERELTDSSIEYFIIFAHEPLYSIKTKISEDDGKYFLSSFVHELTGLLMDNSVGKKIYYVCADVHMYQSGIITDESGHIIHQIVCGTGGAEKDSFVFDDRIFKKSGYSYCVNITKDSYGYVDLSIDSNGVNWKYINVLPDGQTIIYNKKYFVQY